MITVPPRFSNRCNIYKHLERLSFIVALASRVMHVRNCRLAVYIPPGWSSLRYLYPVHALSTTVQLCPLVSTEYRSPPSRTGCITLHLSVGWVATLLKLRVTFSSRVCFSSTRGPQPADSRDTMQHSEGKKNLVGNLLCIGIPPFSDTADILVGLWEFPILCEWFTLLPTHFRSPPSISLAVFWEATYLPWSPGSTFSCGVFLLPVSHVLPSFR
ncbi:hypothetical protein EDD17DRAFT_945062 [Pisolithus thermaeus]|nr:hypothetical protein EDD17DRAFT_945062 [Pisolithus thermaeus]